MSETAPPEREATAYVGLGSNLGDRAGTLRAAVEALGRLPGSAVRAASGVFETEAHTRGEAQPPYLNAAIELATRLSPDTLLAHLLRIEREAGRDRAADARWAARPLDLDLLLYGDAVIEKPDLTVPHPRLAARRFVLAPLAELAPEAEVPGLGQTVAALLAACPDAHAIARTDLSLFP